MGCRIDELDRTLYESEFILSGAVTRSRMQYNGSEETHDRM